ncbi:hypothetical protein LL946_07955 [Knoellia locipacati]|uniref:hypothetical protein n=1 Tax=Knoellia locipacati TaxID=882824 RepID=UPI00384DA8F8
MDPVSIIVAAVVAGAGSALSDAVKDEVKAAYSALRKALLARFSDRRSVTQGVERLEEHPDNVDRRDALTFALSDEGAGEDKELVAMAQSVVDATGSTAENIMRLARDARVSDSPQRATASGDSTATNRMEVGEGATVTGSGQSADAGGSGFRPGSGSGAPHS